MKKIISLTFLFLITLSSAQSNRWSDLFSYNNVRVIKEDSGKLIAATENGIFYYNIATGEITKLSKANGLHEVKITAFDYNPVTKVGLIGYNNGNMDVLTPEGITLVVDIPIAAGFTGDKKINHISINGNKAIVSVAYGVSVFDLDRKEFGDTCFFVNGSNYTAAAESVIKDDKVFTATATGIFVHDLNVTFPVFSTWNNVFSGNFTQIANDGSLVVAAPNQAFIWNGTSFSGFGGGFSAISDVVVSGQDIVIADNSTVKVYNASGAIIKQANFSERVNTGIQASSQLYAGTLLNGIKDQSGNLLKPDGPYNNRSYRIDILGNQIVIASGNRDDYLNPLYTNLGYYHFDGTKWNYPNFFISPLRNWDIIDAVINRNKPEEIFFTNYSLIPNEKGIYKMINNEFSKIYENTHPSINNLVLGFVYDENNQMFASTSYLGSVPWKVGYYYYDAAADKFLLNSVVIANKIQKPFAKNGILHLPAPGFDNGGLLMYNYKNTPASTADDAFKIIRKTNNLPVDGVVCGVVDKNDDVWIGTLLGLRVLSDPEAAITEDNPQAEEIIIEQNGLGEELFRDNHILSIAVDGGNQKWVATESGGVFYLSPNGEQTFQHFTKANSPLPSDNVTDIKVDEKTGKVYFVTLDGVVVYQGDVVEVTENFGDVLVYPNPVVYANYKGSVRIRGLAQKTNIRITDAAGNLVHQAVARGGFYEWNLNNQRGVRVASGIYFVLMTNEDGTDTATAKIAVVN